MSFKQLKWVICVGVPWNRNSMQSIANVMLTFRKRGIKVLWINPVIKINKSYKDIGRKNKSFFLKRTLYKLKIYLKLFKTVESDFYIFSPLSLPVLKNHDFFTINKFLFNIQLFLVFRLLKIKDILLYSSGYYEAILYPRLIPYKYWWHEYPDLDSDNRNISNQQSIQIRNFENQVIQRSDLILASSRRIFDKIVERTINTDKLSHIKLFPHGVDFKHFNDAIAINRENLIVNNRMPIIGYFGSLTNANDQSIYIEIAKAGYNLVLIGDVLADYTMCKKFPNIIFTGSKDYKELPSYVKCFDVGIMSWKWSEHIYNCNPKKTLEYFSCGIPVVSIPIPQLVDEFGELIYYAETPQEFISQIEKAIVENNSQKIQQRISFSSERDWDKKIALLIEEFEKENNE